MKRPFVGSSILLFLILGLSGCSTVGSKNASQSLIYSIAAILSLLLLIGCCLLVRKKKIWLVLLFSSVFVVNIGYTLLAMSSCLELALWANRVAYLGSVFLPLAMLMIILDVSGIKCPKWLHFALGALSIGVFLIAASPGVLDIYYKEVSFAVVNGVSTLVKVYGPLHPLYLFYLLGYFAAMVTIIIRAQIKKTIDTTAHAVILVIAVFVNIGVWLIEQLVSIDFEMLSISYIISEMFLLSAHLVMSENQRLKELVRQKEEAEIASLLVENKKEISSPAPEIGKDVAELFVSGYDMLTPKELELFEAYVSGETTKDILATLNIKENTLKYHSRNLYSKLGVTSRKQLVAVYRRVRASGGFIGEENNVTVR